MAAVSLQCTNCGKEVHGDDTLDKCFCLHCGQTVELPLSADSSLRKPPERSFIEVGFKLLGVDQDGQTYDQRVREAEANFNKSLQVKRENHLAWMGLFICMLRNAEITFKNIPKIEGTLYWFATGIKYTTTFYQVESYFCRVVSRHGHNNPTVLDDILQPGRKAKLYLDNAIRYAPEEEKSAVEDIRFTYFDKPLEEMARFGMEEVLRQERTP